jgi:hypothetical protein
VSYYLYVTRKDDPFGEAGPEITRGEWQAIVDADADLTMADPPGKNVKDPGIYAMWADYYPNEGPIWFGLSEGNISINLHGGAIAEDINPGIIAKLRSFAAITGGYITSELGECF